MDGLRDLARSSLFSVSFCSRPDDQFTTLSIARTANGFDTKVASLSRAELRNFFKCGSEIAPAGPSATCYTLKLACIPADGFGQIYVDLSDFQNLLQTMELDPWIEHLIRSRSYGFHHSGRPGVDSVASYFLGTTFLWTVWTCRRQESGSFVTRCLVFGSKHVTFPRDFVQPNGLSGHLAAFAKESHSALYLPFVLAINALRWREGALMRSLNTVRGVESKTGHGSWGAGRFTAERDSIPALTARLGSELNTVSNTTRHLSFVEAILDHLDHLEQQDGETESSEAVRASDRSILCAARILRQQCSSAQAQCAYLELRIRSQSSVVSVPCAVAQRLGFRDDALTRWPCSVVRIALRAPDPRRLQHQHPDRRCKQRLGRGSEEGRIVHEDHRCPHHGVPARNLLRRTLLGSLAGVGSA